MLRTCEKLSSGGTAVALSLASLPFSPTAQNPHPIEFGGLAIVWLCLGGGGVFFNAFAARAHTTAERARQDAKDFVLCFRY